MKNTQLEKAVNLLAKELALESCNKVDIVTTAEGRSALKYHYENAHKMVLETVDNYLDKV